MENEFSSNDLLQIYLSENYKNQKPLIFSETFGAGDILPNQNFLIYSLSENNILTLLNQYNTILDLLLASGLEFNATSPKFWVWDTGGTPKWSMIFSFKTFNLI
jgi:hypothetical protein